MVGRARGARGGILSKLTEKEKPTLISIEKKAELLCKCWTKKRPPTLKLHMKQVFSDGWTRWVCSTCGKVKFNWRKEAKVHSEA